MIKLVGRLRRQAVPIDLDPIPALLIAEGLRAVKAHRHDLSAASEGMGLSADLADIVGVSGRLVSVRLVASGGAGAVETVAGDAEKGTMPAGPCPLRGSCLVSPKVTSSPMRVVPNGVVTALGFAKRSRRHWAG